VIGGDLPPYVFNQMNSGIEIEIIREALKVKKHTVVFVSLPPSRLKGKLKTRKVDGVSENSISNLADEVGISVYTSLKTVDYHNFAISSASTKLQINSIEDLKKVSVLAFKNASKYLGVEFAEMSKENQLYKEDPNQSLQVKKLLAGRVAIVISEKRIFNYWKHESVLENPLFNRNKNKGVKFHDIFEPSPRSVNFIDKNLRDVFNYGLREIKENGLYIESIKKYEEL
jgi:polar amino acid transport system substrate-binding protein